MGATDFYGYRAEPDPKKAFKEAYNPHTDHHEPVDEPDLPTLPEGFRIKDLTPGERIDPISFVDASFAQGNAKRIAARFAGHLTDYRIIPA